MKKRKLLTMFVVAGPLLFWAGAALASASGVASVDTVINTAGRCVQAAGFGIFGYGAVGIIHHIQSGSWLGATSHLGLSALGGEFVMNYPTASTTFGGTAAALIHPVVNHPATHLALHTATRALM